MYEDYMQNFLNYPVNGYRNTYEQMTENYPYSYSSQNMYGYGYNPQGCVSCGTQNRSNVQNNELENYYPEIYKVVYPMVKKVCSTNNRGITKETIDSMVEEIYNNVETNEAVKLNITLNNDIRGAEVSENKENQEESRQIRRNPGLNDLIRILILRELLGRPGCIGPNCRPNPRPPRPTPWPRPPFPRYDLGETELGENRYLQF